MSKQDRSEVVREWADDLNFAVAKELWNFPHKYGGSNFSDIRDDKGNYYVDLVLGGGGMLGMAHAGFIHALEESDLRFRAIAGSSAGALSAALLMAIDPDPDDPDQKWKGLTLGAFLGALDGDELLDTITGRTWFHWKFRDRRSCTWIPNAIVVIRYLFFRGMIKGDAYEDELEKTLKTLGKNAQGQKELVHRMTTPPDLDIHHETGEDDIEGLEHMRLAIVAADITKEEKVEYPRDKDQFVEDKDQLVEDKDQLVEDKEQLEKDIKSVARWVRASSSVPIFFEPVRMKRKRTPTAKGDSPPLSVYIVDGGLMSNFPISTFHRQDEKEQEKPEAEADPKKRVEGGYLTPRLPTFGVQLLTGKNRPNKTDGPWLLFKALISSMLDVGDKDFIETNPDYRLVVTKIDVTEIEPFKSSKNSFEEFNLYLTKKQKIKLFVHGYVHGKNFLKTFDWYGYKNLRREMAPAWDKNRESRK